MKWIFLVLVISGCATSPTGVRLLEQDGHLQVTPAESDEYDYRVYLKSFLEPGYTTNSKQDRLKTINIAMQRFCSSYEIVKETPIDRGKNFVGRQMVDYYYFVKCG